MSKNNKMVNPDHVSVGKLVAWQMRPKGLWSVTDITIQRKFPYSTRLASVFYGGKRKNIME